MQVDEALKELYKGDSERKELALDFYHRGESEPFLSIGGNNILSESMKLSESLSNSENLDFGSCEASQLEITLIGIGEDLEGAELCVSQCMGVYPSENLQPSEWVFPGGYVTPFGKYIVQSAESGTNRRYRDLLALDYMTLFDVDVTDWYNSLEFPMLLQDFRASLCGYVGVEEEVTEDLPNDDMIIEKTIDPSALMGRDVLIACEQINGVFGHFDRDGILKHISLAKTTEESTVSDEDIEAYLCISCDFEEYAAQSIDKVRIRQEEGDIGAIYGEGTNCYTVEGNFLAYGKTAEELEQIAAGLYHNVSGCMYVPCELTCKGLPYLEVGELLWINKESFFTYIMKRTLNGIHALRDRISSTGEKIRSVESNVNTEIIQLKGRTAVITKNVDAVSVRVTDLASETEAMFEIMSDEISMKVTQGDVTNQLNSELTLTGNAIALTTGHFTIDAENLTVDSAGNATFSGRVTGASFEGGIIEVGVFYADDEDVWLGDWYVSSDGSNIFRSKDGSVSFQTAEGGPFGSYATLVLEGESGTTTVSDHHVETRLVQANTMHCGELYPEDEWWDGWSLTRTMKWLAQRITDLEETS